MLDKYQMVLDYRKYKEAEAIARREADEEARAKTGTMIGEVVDRPRVPPMDGSPVWTVQEDD